MIIEINDYNSKELDIYARCNEPELLHFYEPDLGIFIAESPKVIKRALDSGYEAISLLVSKHDYSGEASEIISLINDSVPVYIADDSILEQITGYKLVRGALCAMRRKKHKEVNDICHEAARIAVLEDVVNPTNLGAIFRSAAALGINGILLTPNCADPLYRRCLRVSMGTVFQIPWTYICDDDSVWKSQGISILHNYGFKTAAMALESNSVSIKDKQLNLEEKLAIILGNEGNGLAKTTIENSDYTVLIPMKEGVDSLNVAAASAVAFWQLA